MENDNIENKEITMTRSQIALFVGSRRRVLPPEEMCCGDFLIEALKSWIFDTIVLWEFKHVSKERLLLCLGEELFDDAWKDIYKLYIESKANDLE